MEGGEDVGGSGIVEGSSRNNTNTANRPTLPGTSTKRLLGASEPDIEFVNSQDSDDDPEPRMKRFKKMQEMPTLRELAERGLIKQIRTAIDGCQPNANYCCGGATEGDPSSSIIVRWDNPDEDGNIEKIKFPLGEKEPRQLRILHNVCRTRTGLAALAKEEFSVDIDPYTVGIVDAIGRTILPHFNKRSMTRSFIPPDLILRADLLELRVRAVGTDCVSFPSIESRRTYPFGKLIISLPCAHKGGELYVSNKGHSTTFDLTKHSPGKSGVQWAAFFTECEHHLKPVVGGYQVLLIYDLYLDEKGHVIRSGSTIPIDATLFPLYDGLKKTLETPGFMKNGGNLGFYCRHPYSHVGSNTVEVGGENLRGLDRIVYSIFKSFGLNVQIRPLLSFSTLTNFDLREYEEDADEYEADPESWLEWEGLDNMTCYCGECFPDFPNFEEWKAKRPNHDFVGSAFHPLKHSFTADEIVFRRMEKQDAILETWDHEKYSDIRWLNKLEESTDRPWELAVVNQQDNYDDWPELEKYYSLPILLVRVPKMMDRDLMKVKNSALKMEA